MADFNSTCHVGNKRRVNVTPLRADGSAGEIQAGSFNVDVLEGEGAVVSHDDGGFEWAPTSPAVTLFHLTGDADLGEGVRPIEATVEGTGLVPEAVSFGGFSEGAETPA